MKFNFDGSLSASKSLMNRALICQNYEPNLKVVGETRAEDVLHLQSALGELHARTPIHCGEGGTVIRFMALRASRIVGTHVLTGSQRLMSRPLTEIQDILKAFSVGCEINESQITISGNDWQEPAGIIDVPMERSTQFASALVINAWELPFDLNLRVVASEKSIGYWKMTLSLVRKFGMQVDEIGESLYCIPKMQKPRPMTYEAEIDLSSAFSVAAAAVLVGTAKIRNFPVQSLQPDIAFVEILKAMGADVDEGDRVLVVKRCTQLRPIKWNIAASPDLFPVLAVLCTQTQGVSVIQGAPHLVHKESNRIGKIEELLQKAGIQCLASKDGLRISGNCASPRRPFKFDPDSDHRVAMAAGLLKLLGYPIEILNPEVVNKSFPEFWEILGHL